MPTPSNAAPPMDARVEPGHDNGESRAPRYGGAMKFRHRLPGIVIATVLVFFALYFDRWYNRQELRLASGEAVGVVDGDTVRANGVDYRLAGIDAPELAQICRDEAGREYACGREARARLRALLRAGEVRCVWSGRDRFERALATCSAGAVADVGEVMVREGHAVDFGGFLTGYGAAEAEARAAKRGIWRGTFEHPQQWRERNPRAADMAADPFAD